MKSLNTSICILVLSILFLCNYASGQVTTSFGNDLIAHDDINYNDEISDLDVAFNGWLYLATSSRHVSPAGTDVVITMSKDSGLTWTYVSNTNGAFNNISSVHIMVAGTDTNSLRVFVAQTGTDIGNVTETGNLTVFDGLSGTILPNPFNAYNLSPDAGSGISMATDCLHPSPGTIGYSVAVLYHSNDSLVCLIAPDAGSIIHNSYLIDTGFASDFSIAYGYSPATGGKYFIAYNSANNVFRLCKNITTGLSGFTAPASIISSSGPTTNLVSPKLVCQNSLTDNDSLGLSVAILNLNHNGNSFTLQALYSMQATNSYYWSTTMVDDSAILGLDHEYDACFNPKTNFIYICGFNETNGKLWARAENFNFQHPDHWLNVSDQYNDSLIDVSVTNYLQPNPSVTALDDKIVSSWCKSIPPVYPYPGGPPHISQTLVDMSDLSSITSTGQVLKNNSTSIYPVPANDYLTICIANFHDSKIVNLELFDITGKVLLSLNAVYKSTMEMKTSELENGIYLLRITYGNYSESRRVVVCH